MGTLLGTEDSKGTATPFCSPNPETRQILFLLMLDFSVGSASLTGREEAAVPSVPHSLQDLPVHPAMGWGHAEELGALHKPYSN